METVTLNVQDLLQLPRNELGPALGSHPEQVIRYGSRARRSCAPAQGTAADGPILR
jgi:hypothetical protein